MHRCLAILAVLGSASRAHADDPRDLFGLRPTAPSDEEPATDPLDERVPFALTTLLDGTYLQRLPVGNNTVDSVGHWAIGAGRDEAGPTFGGATGLENRWTIEGAPADNIRTGAADIRLPLLFVERVTIGAGGFAARDRVGLGGTIDARLIRGGTTHELRTAVFGGLTAATREREPRIGGFNVRRLATDIGPEVNATVVATGPLGSLLGGRAWYAAGIAPSLVSTDLAWTASRIVDRDDDGIPDGYPRLELEGIGYAERRQYDVSVPVLARVGLDKGPHAIDLTLVGHVATSSRYLANSTLQASGVDRLDVVGTGIATYTGTWKNTRARVQLSWQRNDRDETAHDAAAASQAQVLSAYIPTTLVEDPLLAEFCNDMQYPQILQCAVPTGYFASGGAGLLTHAIADRPTATADLAHRTGNHVLRVGGTFEDARLVLRSWYTGGSLVRSLFPGHEDRARFYTGGNCDELPFSPCTITDISELRYRTRYTAAYVEDTWAPAENIRVNGGLRWELMWVGPALHFSNQLAPRAGLSWDILGKGRSRLWVSGGRSFAYLPTGLGATIIARDQVVHDITTGLGGHARDRERGAVYAVPADTQPMAQDELTAGIEVALAKAFRLTAWAQGRYLRRGLETTSNQFTNVGDTLPARRSSAILGIELATEATAQLTVRAGYTVGRTIGNYLGPYDPQYGSILYDGDDFNARFQSLSDYGHLPTDLGQRVFVEADRRTTLGSVELHVATRLTVASGKPRSAFANTDVGYISLIERGSLGRGPLQTQANIRVGARWRGFDVTLDVFNLFNRTEAVGIDDLYADSGVRPIIGGQYEDLVYLKDVLEQPARRRLGYGQPFSFQSPLSAMLGIRRAF